jgi:hypothetical protein
LMSGWTTNRRHGERRSGWACAGACDLRTPRLTTPGLARAAAPTSGVSSSCGSVRPPARSMPTTGASGPTSRGVRRPRRLDVLAALLRPPRRVPGRRRAGGDAKPEPPSSGSEAAGRLRRVPRDCCDSSNSVATSVPNETAETAPLLRSRSLPRRSSSSSLAGVWAAPSVTVAYACEAELLELGGSSETGSETRPREVD